MNLRNYIPSFFTSLNILCGFLGIVFAFNENLFGAGILILVGGFFDLLDGMVARWLNAGSEFGKQLDSLADMVTFGILPGIMVFQYISISQNVYFDSISDRTFNQIALASVGFLITAFSAFRLAKFNIDTRQTEEFIGLPTPANAIFIGSFAIVMHWQYSINYYVPIKGNMMIFTSRLKYWNWFDIAVVETYFSTSFWVVVSILSAALLVSPFRLFSFKMKSLSIAKNKVRYLFLLIMILLLVINFIPKIFSVPFNYHIDFDFLLLPLSIIVYILLSLFYNFANKSNTHEIQS
jgi:CDP-diacylglycerol--serine O-phosphatidyltransferase